MHNLYYKAVDIPGWEDIARELGVLYNTVSFDAVQDLFTQIPIARMIELSPTLGRWLDSFGYTVKRAAIVKCAANKMDYSPHVDSDVSCLAINIPLYNCDQTWTAFYDIVKGGFFQAYQENMAIYYGVTVDAEFVEQCRYQLDRPLLINTKIPHAVFNPTDHMRLALTLRFSNDPWHLFSA